MTFGSCFGCGLGGKNGGTRSKKRRRHGEASLTAMPHRGSTPSSVATPDTLSSAGDGVTGGAWVVDNSTQRKLGIEKMTPKSTEASPPSRIESLVSSDGEYFDCLSEMSDATDKYSRTNTSNELSDKRTEKEGQKHAPAVHSSGSLRTRPSPLRGRLSFKGRINAKTEDAAPNSTNKDGENKVITTEKIAENAELDGDAETASTSSVTAEEQGPKPMPMLSACLSMLRPSQNASLKAMRAMSRRRKYPTKPEAGSSMKRRDAAEDDSVVTDCWEPADPAKFNVRSEQYMRTRKKEPSKGAFYDVIAVDLFSFEVKEHHIACKLTIPPDPYKRTEAELSALKDFGIPPLLVVTLQIPVYQAAIFGGTTDGQGHSIVYWFALHEGFNPSTHKNQAAVDLLQRFVQNSREANSEPTRNRLKLIPRVVNVEEFTAKGPLSSMESRLVNSYNEKPLLTRPQQTFHQGPNYLEVDLDVHTYAFLARKVLHGALGKLSAMVFEIAFVLQGNRADELPEFLLGCVRMYRIDFLRLRPFSEYVNEIASKMQTLGNQTVLSSIEATVEDEETKVDGT